MMKDKIENLLQDHQKFHSEYQIENFIIRSQGGAWAQYKQCLREIASRYDTIQDMKGDMQLIDLEIERLKNKRFFFRRFSKIKHRIELERKQRNLGNLKKSFADTSRELLAFVRIAEGIKLNFWGNGKLSGNKKKMLEENMWFEKAKFMMAVDLMTIGNVSKPTLEMVYAMPKKIRGELMSNLSENGRHNLIAWAME
jgi:hypothetical protein